MKDLTTIQEMRHKPFELESSLETLHFSSAYRYHRISPSLAWKGHARTGFSDEIGMQRARALERKVVV